MMVHNHHFLLATFPAQGHINPTLQFAKRLICIGAQITIATCLSAQHHMTNIPDGLTFAYFSDGYDDGFKPAEHDIQHYTSELKRRGPKTLTEVVLALANEQRPVTCLVYTLLLPWVAGVARECEYSFVIESFREQFDELVRDEAKIWVLVNTFDALELDALSVIKKFNLIGIGPLLPSAFLDGKDPTDTSFGSDLLSYSKDYIEWLETKEKLSVVYVSFGSLAVLEKHQMEEIARGLIQSGRPFLWVVRKPDGRVKGDEDVYQAVNNLKEEMKESLIVPWCSQVKVLAHHSIGCFVIHCGWNSTLESLVGGVPVVAFPQSSDQGTNAKLIQDVWKTGVRVQVNEKEKIVESEEL
ncbi:hypothetical protein GIB67_034940 [Kingdonia uniflora]|uniref:Glycosyltransferase n=1 Tax=Kingdonia uniflora TaxID=39325 RepID=A0A7J7NGM6_9MAGN|nr:hypothetical protein GIB67_034940 [Kingdonia uniflora]